MSSKYTLIAGNKQFELSEHQSPRGLRNGTKRPSIVKIDVKEEFDYIGLKKHIDYLTTVLCAMDFTEADHCLYKFCECGLPADGILHGKPMCERCMYYFLK